MDSPGAASAPLSLSPLQVLMRLGRQRWRLKGRIEPDDSQTWDEEERVFVPTVHENLEIKVCVWGAGGGGRGRAQGGAWSLGAGLRHHCPVPCAQVTELRGLSSMVVGAVTCDVVDFFTARPQLVVVDITELGTIKLQLELLWK